MQSAATGGEGLWLRFDIFAGSLETTDNDELWNVGNGHLTECKERDTSGQ